MADNPQTAAGGAVSALDPSTEKDRGLMRTAMARWPKRWRGMSEEKKDLFAKILGEAGEKAGTALQTTTDIDQQCKVIGEIASIVRTAVMMEAQNQSDDHLADKNGRLADGLPTERVETSPVEIRVIGMSNTANNQANATPDRQQPTQD